MADTPGYPADLVLVCTVRVQAGIREGRVASRVCQGTLDSGVLKGHGLNMYRLSALGGPRGWGVHTRRLTSDARAHRCPRVSRSQLADRAPACMTDLSSVGILRRSQMRVSHRHETKEVPREGADVCMSIPSAPVPRHRSSGKSQLPGLLAVVALVFVL